MGLDQEYRDHAEITRLRANTEALAKKALDATFWANQAGHKLAASQIEAERLRGELASANQRIERYEQASVENDAGWWAYHRKNAETIARLREAVNMAIDWWELLPPSLRQDIEGSGAVPGWVAKARAALAPCPENE